MMLPGSGSASGAPVPPHDSGTGPNLGPTFSSFGTTSSMGDPRTFMGSNPEPRKTNITGTSNTTITAKNFFVIPDKHAILEKNIVFSCGNKPNENTFYTLQHLNAELLRAAYDKHTSGARKPTSRAGCFGDDEDKKFTDLECFLRTFKFLGFGISSTHPFTADLGYSKRGIDKTWVTTWHHGLLHNVPQVWGPDLRAGDEVCLAVKVVDHESSKQIKNANDEVVSAHSSGFQTLRVIPSIIRGGVPLGFDGENSFTSVRQKVVKVPGYDDKSGYAYELSVDELIPSLVWSIGIIKDIKLPGLSASETEEAIMSNEGYKYLRSNGPKCDILMNTRRKAKFLSIR